MPDLKSKPLLTRADLPLHDVAKICARWGVREMAIDPGRQRPASWADNLVGGDNPFVDVDLYLIADFGPGDYSWHFKKHHFDVVAELNNLLGCRVWIEDKELLERHIDDGREWARREMERRDVIYCAPEETDMLRKSEPGNRPSPPEMAGQVDDAALEREWQAVYRYGEQMARAQGLKPEDVSRLVREYRDELSGGTV